MNTDIKIEQYLEWQGACTECCIKMIYWTRAWYCLQCHDVYCLWSQ